MKSILFSILLCANANAASFAFDITSVAGHHEYVSRSNDSCNGDYFNGDDLSIGCDTYSHTQPVIFPQYNPQIGEGSGTILVAYTHTAANGHPLVILEFDECWFSEADANHAVATCARSSDDGFVDGFDCRAPYPNWCNKIILL